MIRLYHFLDTKESKYGEEFAVCDDCIQYRPVPQWCRREKVEDHASRACNECGRKPAVKHNVHR